MGGMISGLLGGGSSAGQEAQMAEMAKAREAIQQYRPEAMNARLNALRNASGAYQGANNALETMYGGGGGGPSLGPVAAMKGKLGAAQVNSPRRFMGHDLPSMHPSQGAMPGPTGPTGQPGPQRPRQPGQSPDAAEAAFMLMDPLNLFGGY